MDFIGHHSFLRSLHSKFRAGRNDASIGLKPRIWALQVKLLFMSLGVKMKRDKTGACCRRCGFRQQLAATSACRVVVWWGQRSWRITPQAGMIEFSTDMCGQPTATTTNGERPLMPTNVAKRVFFPAFEIIDHCDMGAAAASNPSKTSAMPC